MQNKALTANAGFMIFFTIIAEMSMSCANHSFKCHAGCSLLPQPYDSILLFFYQSFTIRGQTRLFIRLSFWQGTFTMYPQTSWCGVTHLSNRSHLTAIRMTKHYH